MPGDAPPSRVAPADLGALAVVQVLFGTLPIAGKVAFASFTPGVVTTTRVVAAALAFQAVRLLRRERAPPLRDLPVFALAALLGVAANQLLFIHGLSRTSAMHAVLLVCTVPIFTLVIAVALGTEQPSWRRLLGVVTAILGAAILVVGRGAGGGTAALDGDLMVLANCAAYAAYLVLSRQLLQRHDPWTVGATVFTLGAAMVVPFTGAISRVEVTPGAWATLGFIVLGPTIGTYYLNLSALRNVKSSVVAVFVNVQPLVTALLAGPILGESLSLRTVIAGALTLVGVGLAAGG
jgi:drug/metabolite transporter (DMT)-like permease